MLFRSQTSRAHAAGDQRHRGFQNLFDRSQRFGVDDRHVIDRADRRVNQSRPNHLAQYIATPLASPVSLEQILAALQAGPPVGALGQGLRTAVPVASTDADALHAENTNAGVAVVDLPRRFFDTIAVNDQRLVIAQIVLTLTDSRGIGQVTFNQVVTRPNGESVPSGSPLSKADFVALLDSSYVGPMNIGNDGEFTLNELARLVLEVTNSSSEIVFEPLPVDDPTQRKPDLTLARSVLGFEPRVPLHDGLVATAEYFARKLGV